MMDIQQGQQIEAFSCKNNMCELSKIDQLEKAYLQACFCGSIFCLPLPKIFNYAKNPNFQYLFFENEESAQSSQEIPPQHSKDQLLIPAKGKIKRGKYHGLCFVCNRDYVEYIKHIESQGHKHQIRKNKFNEDILDLCNSIKQQAPPKLSRIKNRFANKDGKTKKLRYSGRNKNNGKFTNKS